MFTSDNMRISKIFISNLIDNIPSGYNKRMEYSPITCNVFKSKYIRLKYLKGCKFKTNSSSKKKFKNISQEIYSLVKTKKGKTTNSYKKKLRLGVVFSGGPAPGGHNVVSGLFDALKNVNNESILFGFIMGFEGMINCNYIKLSRSLIDKYRNIGGFDLIMTGRKKLNDNYSMNSVVKNCKRMKLDGVIIVGGDDSNTNAAFLSEKLFSDNINIIGIPKTIDRDLQFKEVNKKFLCSTSFGFDTASKNFSYSISNLCNDARSSGKYWHICKVMGRVASHLALEVAYQTNPHLTLIGEEFSLSRNGNITIDKIITIISNAIITRAKKGGNFGVIVIPEGILEFISETKLMINKVGDIISKFNKKNKDNFHKFFDTLNKKIAYISKLAILCNKKNYKLWSVKDNIIFTKLPILLKKGLLSKRDNHGNFQFSSIKTEKILVALLKKKLKFLKEKGEYTIGIKKEHYHMSLKNSNINVRKLGNLLFKNCNKNDYLIFHNKINNKKKLLKVLSKENSINLGNNALNLIKEIFNLSRANFKSQTHFYGYDGRGAHPTIFDCTLAYNLGLTAFHLINKNLSGLMASIVNLENNTKSWNPIGIPIPLLMDVEIRNGKPSLVIKKTTINLKSLSFKIFKKERKKWLISINNFKKNKIFDPEKLSIKNENLRPITLLLDSVSTYK